jgi:hypothetical protein
MDEPAGAMPGFSRPTFFQTKFRRSIELANALRTLTEASWGRRAEKASRSVLEEATEYDEVVGGLEINWSCSDVSRCEITAKVPFVGINPSPAFISIR